MTTLRTFRGLTFGGSSDYRIMSEQGLDDLRVRSGARNLPRLHGAVPGEAFAHPREIILEAQWRADTPALAETLTRAFESATGPSSGLHQYVATEKDGSQRMVRARVLTRSLPRTRGTQALGIVTAVLVLEAPDPRIYAPPLTGLVVPEFDLGGEGYDFPGDFPENANAPTQAVGTAVNTGNADAYPLIRFDAGNQVTQVTLTNLTNGAVLDIQTTIASGQILLADMDALIRATGDPIVHIAGSSRFADWQTPRDPFSLAPGTNFLKFEHDGSAGDVICRVDWRHTSL